MIRYYKIIRRNRGREYFIAKYTSRDKFMVIINKGTLLALGMQYYIPISIFESMGYDVERISKEDVKIEVL